MLRLTHHVGGNQRATYVRADRVMCIQEGEKYTQVHLDRGPTNAALVVNAIEPAGELDVLVEKEVVRLADAALYKIFSGEALSAFETRIVQRIVAMMEHKTIKCQAELVKAAEDAGTAGAVKYLDKLAAEVDPAPKPKAKGKTR